MNSSCNTYSEIFELLKITNQSDIKKIPINILKVIKDNRNKEYIPDIDINNINKSVSKNALSLYVWLYLNYIVDNSNEKLKIYQKLDENERKKEVNINREIFNNVNKINKEIKKEENLIIYKENIFKKILNKIKGLLKLGRN